ncbi:biotin carboxylase [Streptacidiphilus sp. BW17]|uniref:ATP-grasp domain-containing protein n=1 Tax=Streptacidiphilus sp. BW17 TaxID=3156274 RepID=UPI003514C52B
MSTSQTDPAVLLVGRFYSAALAMQRLSFRAINIVTPSDLSTLHAEVSRDDVIVVSETDDIGELLSALARHGLRPEDFQAIYSQRERAVIAASVLAQLGGTEGMSVQVALALRDKQLQKIIVREAGITTARSRVADQLSEFTPGDDFEPCVIKPLDGGGSQDTHLVRSHAQFDELSERIGSTGPWLIEELIEGTEIHIDGVVKDGTVTFLSIGRYLHNVISIKDGAFIASVHLDPQHESGLYARAHDLVHASLNALGHRDGSFHLEAFERGEELVFSECGGRIGGGMIREAVEWKYGVVLVEEWARAVCHIEEPIAVTVREGTCGFVHLPTPPGRILRMPTKEDLLAMPGCVAADVYQKAGGTAPDVSRASSARAARALVSGRDADEVRDRIIKLVDWFLNAVEVEPVGSTK